MCLPLSVYDIIFFGTMSVTTLRFVILVQQLWYMLPDKLKRVIFIVIVSIKNAGGYLMTLHLLCCASSKNGPWLNSFVALGVHSIHCHWTDTWCTNWRKLVTKCAQKKHYICKFTEVWTICTQNAPFTGAQMCTLNTQNGPKAYKMCNCLHRM